jgi:hypothetical protein
MLFLKQRLDCKAQHNIFSHQQNKGEAKGTRNTAASETPLTLPAIEKCH